MNIIPFGIDVAKLKFNVCLIRDDGRLKHKVFANTQAGFSQLTAWLSANGAEFVHACLESTGTYGEALATYLADTGHEVSVVNPAQIKSYAGCQLSRTKTDKVDAENRTPHRQKLGRAFGAGLLITNSGTRRFMLRPTSDQE